MAMLKNDPLRLPIVTSDLLLGDGALGVDIDEELRRLDAEQAQIEKPAVQTEHWVDAMVNPQFKKSKRAETTLLVSGLTAAHDFLIQGALSGLGYKVEVIDCPDNDALRFGKEF